MKELTLIEKNDKLYRICRKCNNELEVINFDKCSKTKCGFRSVCKSCRSAESKQNSKQLKIVRKKYYEANKEVFLEKCRLYKIENKEKILESAKKYRENNKLKVSLSKRLSTKKRYKSDGFFRLKTQLRKYSRRYFNIKTSPKKTMDILGCSPKELKIKIESQFEAWMSWDNYGYGKNKWVIDHIIPLSSAKNEEELYMLCHYTNLQPLSWEENMKKGNKF
jgi:cobalamin biosynthesis protein CbiG